jgi:SAM-dependent methyltransferase
VRSREASLRGVPAQRGVAAARFAWTGGGTIIGSIRKGNRMSASLYRILDRPIVYKLGQQLLAPGAERIITRRLAHILAAVPHGEPLLDVGCGPRSWLAPVGLAPFGLDINPAYVRAYCDLGSPGVVASAVEMPFADHSFAGVWSIGLLHHLDDEPARLIVAEAVRVTRPRGYVAILDAVTPVGPTRPLAGMIRKWDRGRFMRSEQGVKALLPKCDTWECERFTAAATGLEMLSCLCKNTQA